MTTSDCIAKLKTQIVHHAEKARQLRAEARRAGKEASQHTVGSDDYYKALRPGCYAWYERVHDLRPWTRHLLLAYGFLRNRTYRQIEPKVAEDNEPAADGIWKELRERGWAGSPDLIYDWLDRGDVRLIELDPPKDEEEAA